MTTASSGVTVYVDGASKGNPGHAGIGIRVESGGELIKEFSDYLGITTNNFAEYKALIKGLQLATELKANEVSVISDSELVVKQINGQYKVKNAQLLPLFREASKLSRGFATFNIRHIRRSLNSEADRLANEGIQEGTM